MLIHEIAHIAEMIGDQTRAHILIALMEGRALTAGELAIRSAISPQTASNHLKKLLAAKLIIYIKTPTRYRYYKIASPLVAQALEALSLLSDSPKKRIPPHHEKLDREMCFARTCYDHLAGEMGVKMTKALLLKKFLCEQHEQFHVTEQGERFFKQFGIECQALRKLRREFAKPCLDWTEREYHLAGSLGCALLEYLLKQRLILRSKKKSRVILLTTAGQLWFKQYLA